MGAIGSAKTLTDTGNGFSKFFPEFTAPSRPLGDGLTGGYFLWPAPNCGVTTGGRNGSCPIICSRNLGNDGELPRDNDFSRAENAIQIILHQRLYEFLGKQPSA